MKDVFYFSHSVAVKDCSVWSSTWSRNVGSLIVYLRAREGRESSFDLEPLFPRQGIHGCPCFREGVVDNVFAARACLMSPAQVVSRPILIHRRRLLSSCLDTISDSRLPFPVDCIDVSLVDKPLYRFGQPSIPSLVNWGTDGVDTADEPETTATPRIRTFRTLGGALAMGWGRPVSCVWNIMFLQCREGLRVVCALRSRC